MEFAVIEILSGFEAAKYYNYFFTLVMIAGWFAFGLGLLVNTINKS